MERLQCHTSSDGTRYGRRNPWRDHNVISTWNCATRLKKQTEATLGLKNGNAFSRRYRGLADKSDTVSKSEQGSTSDEYLTAPPDLPVRTKRSDDLQIGVTRSLLNRASCARLHANTATVFPSMANVGVLAVQSYLTQPFFQRWFP